MIPAKNFLNGAQGYVLPMAALQILNERNHLLKLTTLSTFAVGFYYEYSIIKVEYYKILFLGILASLIENKLDEKFYNTYQTLRKTSVILKISYIT